MVAMEIYFGFVLQINRKDTDKQFRWRVKVLVFPLIIFLSLEISIYNKRSKDYYYLSVK